MSDTREIEAVALDIFSFLHEELGFNKPFSSRETWSTTVSYLSKEIGIEIELDWRNLDVFIIVTRLDEGRLPKGYYVSQGKTCRVHLERVLQDRFDVGKDEIQEIAQFNREKYRQRSRQSMEERIVSYQRLLRNYAESICSAGGSIFQ